jgi:hypothetical protein
MRPDKPVRILVVMAHSLDIREAERNLHELRHEEWSDLTLAAVAIVGSLIATQAAPTLALPLFAGGVVVAILGGRAFFRRWDLCERLMLDPEAFQGIPEIHARVEDAASVESRAILARSARDLLAAPAPYRTIRIDAFAAELAKLADELDDRSLELDPLCAVRCKRLLTDTSESALLNPAVPADGLRIALKLIRAGFEPPT